MVVTVKDVMCGGALVTSDALKHEYENEFTGYAVTVLTGELLGRVVPVCKSGKDNVGFECWPA